ncbi:MAG TPA: DUF3352 domain-containing protein [Candidatus Limnocylindria bacterium]
MITEPVVPTKAPEPTPTVSRRQVAVIAAVAVLAAAIGLVLGLSMMQTRASTLAPAAGYVPAGSLVYMEADLSLPPNQQDALRAILARFPGTDPDAAMGDGLARTLDAALVKSDAPFDYSNDIAPWFEGTVAVAVLDQPLDMESGRPPATGVLLAVSDAAAASSFGDSLREAVEADGGSWSSSDAGGVTVWTLDTAPTTGASDMHAGFAYGVTDDQFVLGTSRATVEALLAVQRGSGDSLADGGEVSDLVDRLPAERAGVMTMNVAALMRSMSDQLGEADTELRDLLDEQLASVPDTVVAALSFEDDAIVVSGATSLPADAAPANATRTLAASVPGDAIFFADAPNVGANASAGLARLRAQLESGDAGDELDQLEQMEAALGGRLDELFDWIGGGAVAAGWDGEQPYVGLVLEVTDADAADERLRQLQSLLSLATMDPASEVEVTTETVAGVEVTSIRFTTMTPTFGSDAGEKEAVIQYAMDGEHLFIGVGDRFVSRALQLAPGESLADNPRYTEAIGRFGGANNAGGFFLDLATLRETVEAEAGEMLPPEYASEVQPYLQPLDLLAGVTRVEGDAVVTRYGLVLR